MKQIKDIDTKVLEYCTKIGLLDGIDLNEPATVFIINFLEGNYEEGNGLKMDYLVESGDSLLDSNNEIK